MHNIQASEAICKVYGVPIAGRVYRSTFYTCGYRRCSAYNNSDNYIVKVVEFLVDSKKVHYCCEKCGNNVWRTVEQFRKGFMLT